MLIKPEGEIYMASGSSKGRPNSVSSTSMVKCNPSSNHRKLLDLEAAMRATSSATYGNCSTKMAGREKFRSNRW